MSYFLEEPKSCYVKPRVRRGVVTWIFSQYLWILNGYNREKRMSLPAKVLSTGAGRVLSKLSSKSGKMPTLWCFPGTKSSGSGTWPKSSRRPPPWGSGRPSTTCDTAQCHSRPLGCFVNHAMVHRG